MELFEHLLRYDEAVLAGAVGQVRDEIERRVAARHQALDRLSQQQRS